MVSATAIVLPVLFIFLAAAYFYYALRVHGWSTVKQAATRFALSLPATTLSWGSWLWNHTLTLAGYGTRYNRLDGLARQRARRGAPIPLEHLQFVRYVDPSHRFSLMYPSTWSLARTENPAASIIVQVTSDGAEDAYKRFSVAWDDVSWSPTTAESFGRNVARQLPSLVPGAVLVTHGLYNPTVRSDRAYEIIYRIADAVDGSELELLNVVIVAAHGGRRRAYTLTFGADSQAFEGAQRLAARIIDSFRFDEASGPGVGGGVAGTATPTSAQLTMQSQQQQLQSAREVMSPSDAGSDDVHVNVWDRVNDVQQQDADSAVASPLQHSAAAASADAAPLETPSSPAVVSWAPDAVVQAGLAFQRPARWLSSGTGYDGAPGFAPLASTAVRRWTAAYTCDRREASFKHLSVVCVDLTPCYELVAARAGAIAARGGDAPAPADRAPALLVSYLAYRYRGEAASADALSRGVPPPTAVQPSNDEAALLPWLELFAARWPASCRITTPVAAMVSTGMAAAKMSGTGNVGSSGGLATAPSQCTITDSRVVGGSLLLKVRGWLRTAAAAPTSLGGTAPWLGNAGTGGANPSPVRPGRSSSEGLSGGPQRHYSTYSNLSMENEALLAEGLLVSTTSAVLIGVYETAADPGSASSSRRVWGHIVTFAASSETFATYEPLARHIFHSLVATVGP